MRELVKYHNGNTTVSILEDGTKIREWEGIPEIIHPESIDIKITDYCNLGCLYCHESSTKSGIHSDLIRLRDVLNELPAGVELAIGGGNPLDHPDLLEFLKWCKNKGFIVNLTVNQGHLKSHKDLIGVCITKDLIKGLGISITGSNFKEIKKLKYPHIVYHVIAGVNPVHILDQLMELGPAKILVLGYKTFGFGVRYYSSEIEVEIQDWYRKLPSYIGKCLLSFDNLAIEQLNIKRLFTEEGWSRFYMGDDFTFTMYIDAVKKQYAPTSRSSERVSFLDKGLLEYFKNERIRS